MGEAGEKTMKIEYKLLFALMAALVIATGFGIYLSSPETKIMGLETKTLSIDLTGDWRAKGARFVSSDETETFPILEIIYDQNDNSTIFWVDVPKEHLNEFYLYYGQQKRTITAT